MSLSFNPGPSWHANPGPSGLEQHGSPLSERNFSCGSPVNVPGRFSQPDMRCWDPGAHYFSELSTYPDFSQGNAFDDVAQCDVPDLSSGLDTDSLYIPLQEDPTYHNVSDDFRPEVQPLQTSNVVIDQVQQIVDTGTQRIGIFEEITHARCIDCDRVVDSRDNPHTKAACTLSKNHSCSQCSAKFNFEQNFEVHRIVEHSSQDSYVPGTECVFCNSRRKKKTFQRYSAYIAHIKTHVKPDQYFCTTCSEEFSYFALLQRHRRLAHGLTDTEDLPRGFSSELGYCSQCCSLIALDQVEMHRVLHRLHMKLKKERRIPSWKRKESDPPTSQKTSEEVGNSTKASQRRPRRTHACSQCNKVFLRPAELKRHSVIHSETKEKWKCPTCDGEFAHKSGLEAHKKAVHGDPLSVMVTCKICSQRFAKQSNLNRHIKMQHPIRVDKVVLDCPECSCVFATHRTLTRHRRTVHGTTLFPSFCCNVCSRTFLKEAQLRRHMLSHNSSEAQKPFACTRCYRRFNLKSTLKLHMDIHSRKDVDDPILTNPKCPICMKHLSSRNALRKHIAAHERNYECSVCFQKFSTLHRLDKHRCVPHTVLPEEVDGQLTELSTTSKRQLVGDVRQPTKNYQCQLCSNSFYSFRAYKEHCSQHQGLRPHLCWTCHKSFRTSELLELHKEVHSRTPIYCEYCAAILQGRNQYTQHLQSRHQLESGVHKQFGVDLTDRAAGAMSAHSFPELTGRDLAEGLFRTRAQSVDHNDVDTAGELLVSDDRPVRCPVCNHLYDSVSHLVNHWVNCGFDRDHSFCVFGCPLCSRSVNGVADGVEHMKEFHSRILDSVEKQKERPKQRGEQDDVFAAAEEDVADIESPVKQKPNVVYRDERPHKCQTCGAAFTKPSDLVRHLRIHTGERPYKCDICQRAFRVSSSFYAHVRTHTRTQADHPCAVCGAEFFSKSSLALHLRIHNGEKPLKCRRCDEMFRTSSDRRQHEITWHGFPGSHICKSTPCSRCSASKRKRMRQVKREERMWAYMASSGDITAPLAGPPVNRTLLPVKQLAAAPFTSEARNEIHSKQFIETAAQFTSLPANPIKLSAGSAFGPLARTAPPPQPSEVEFFITARRISHNEYSVTFSKSKPKSIRSKVDTTVSLTASLLLDSASRNSSILVTLSDSQILGVSCAGVVKALQSCDSVVMRARPADPSYPSIVELLAPPDAVEFLKRCDVCEVDFHSKEASDAHFLSEDHETAQLTLPLPTAVHDAIDHSILAASAVPLQRKDERADFTCKLCGRKFLDMEPLVAHIRLEHERDHPQGITRPAARTAPIH